MDLRAAAQSNIQQQALLPRGASVLVAVSGGADSMVLLHILNQLSPTLGWSLAVAHFNHCLRGVESDADQAFVQKHAENLGLPFYSASADVKSAAREKGISIEMAGRELRHEFLERIARIRNLTHIALAHHADDQVETFWLRLLRGDVGPGLAGMRWQRPASRGSAILLVRPLLNVTRQELLAFASERKIAFREDRSNLDSTFQRNRLRLQLLPELEKFQPSLRAVTLRAVDVLGEEKSLIEAEARRWLANPIQKFLDLPLALKRETIRLQLISLSVRPSFELIDQLLEVPGRPITVSPGHLLLCSSAGELMPAALANLDFDSQQVVVDLHSQDHASLHDFDFQWEMVPSREPASTGIEFFDADSIGSRLTLRFWKSGDKFQPIGFPQETKLQDLFTNLKIAAEEKRRRPVAAGEDGKIFWVEGLRISDRHKVTPRSARILKWMWQPASGSSQAEGATAQ